jgi:hypothetical protein
MKTLSLLLIFASLAVAAPIPKNLEPKAAAIQRLFGDIVTDDNVSFDLLGKKTLSANIASGFKKRAYEWQEKFPVLSSKEANGDFEVSVKLAITFDKDAKAATGYDKRLCCSGLLLTDGNDATGFIGYNHSIDKKDWQSGLYMLNRSRRGGSSTQMNLSFDSKPYSIRLTRRDGKVSIETAAEGKPYKPFTTYAYDAEDVKISLVHFNTLDGTVTADFEDFVVRAAPEKK